MTLCPTPCCGGWIIEMDGSNYGFDSLPSGCKIDLQTATFPIFVKLDWQRAMNICSNNRIVIQRIVRYYPLD